ncbi:MAG: hypothetical protein A2X22_10250 [Bacteroidetes bacterium GWF2_49_14]|nr:MAG: hypothetical protein A2X22_10250 [Bacteroidetes bacterium GWF2_49_14]HBB92397.1 hypothetical protein [Bacteroidales bacterium]
MTKKFTLITLVLIGIALRLAAQSPGEIAPILQKCMDIPDLQKYYPPSVNDKKSPIYIVQYPVAFPEGIVLTKNGSEVKFITISQLAENPVQEYFMFRSLNSGPDSTTAVINYFYDCNSALKQFKMLTINVDLEKAGKRWNVSQAILKGDTK